MSFASQISNRNFLSPGGFRFVLSKFPKVAYFAQSANVPSLELGLVSQPTPMRPINLDGMMTFGQFTLTFIVDERHMNPLHTHKHSSRDSLNPNNQRCNDS